MAVYSAIFLAARVVLSLVGRIFRKKNGEDSVPSSVTVEDVASPEVSTQAESAEDDSDEECCGEHEVCEKGKIKRALRTDIEYFDDEELDAFLFSLGCYSGEPITVVRRVKGGCVVSIKDGRYTIDNLLAEAIEVNVM